MALVAYSGHRYDCEAEDFEVYFEYNNSVVFSENEETLIERGMQQTSIYRNWSLEMSII